MWEGDNAWYAWKVLTFFLDINAILQLGGALLATQQLLFGLATWQVGGTIAVGVQLTDATPQPLAGVACGKGEGCGS